MEKAKKSITPYNFYFSEIFSIKKFWEFLAKELPDNELSQNTSWKKRLFEFFYTKEKIFEKGKKEQFSEIKKMREATKNVPPTPLKNYRIYLQQSFDEEAGKVKEKLNKYFEKDILEKRDNIFDRFLLNREIRFYSYVTDEKEIEKKQDRITQFKKEWGIEGSFKALSKYSLSDTEVQDFKKKFWSCSNEEEKSELLDAQTILWKFGLKKFVEENYLYTKYEDIDEENTDEDNFYEVCADYLDDYFEKQEVFRKNQEISDSKNKAVDYEKENEFINKCKEYENEEKQLQVYAALGNFFDELNNEGKDVYLITEIFYDSIEDGDLKALNNVKFPNYNDLMRMKKQLEKRKDLEYFIETSKKHKNECRIYVHKKGCDVSVNEEYKRITKVENKNESEYEKKYKEIEDRIEACVRAVMLIASGYMAKDYIKIIFDHKVLEKEVYNLIDLYEKHQYIRASYAINKMLEDRNTPATFKYIYAKMIELDFIKSEVESIDLYKECYNEIVGDETKKSKYIGLACYELAKNEMTKNEIDDKMLVKYVQAAKFCGNKEIFEWEGDLYQSGMAEKLYPVNIKKAYEAYMNAQMESAYNKVYLLLKKLEERQDDITWFEERKKEFLKEISGVYYIKSGSFFLEEVAKEPEQQAELLAQNLKNELKDSSHYFESSIYKQSAGKETFVLLSDNDASQAFIDSIKNKDNIQVILMYYYLNSEKQKELKERYPFATIIEYSLEKLMKELDLYCLEHYIFTLEEEQRIVKNRKIHFIAISDDRTENLSIAIEVMERTWKKQLLYNNLFLNRISLKDLIDITVDIDERNMQLYIDSLQNKFGSFYIKIRNVNYEQEISRNLLFNNPIFLPELSTDTKGNIIILGNDESRLALIKNIISVIYYKTEIDKAGSIMSVIVADQEASKLKNKLLYDCPDVLTYPFSKYFNIEFFDIDVESYEFSVLFENSEISQLSDEQIKLRDKLNDISYFICAMKYDTDGIELCVKLREMLYRRKTKFCDSASIAVLCRNKVFAEKVAQIKVDNIVLSDAWYSNYNIFTYGVYYDIFSYDNIFNNFIIKYGEIINGFFYSDIDDANNVYYSRTYNRDNSEMCALYLVYRMYVIGAFEKNKKWDIEYFIKNIDRFREKFANRVNPSKKEELSELDRNSYERINELAIMEHIRWCCFEVSRGYRKAEREQVVDYINKGNPSHQLYIAKLHPYIVEWDELGERNKKQTAVEKKKKEKMKRFYVKIVELYQTLCGYYARKANILVGLNGSNTESKIEKDYFVNDYFRGWKALQPLIGSVEQERKIFYEQSMNPPLYYNDTKYEKIIEKIEKNIITLINIYLNIVQEVKNDKLPKQLSQINNLEGNLYREYDRFEVNRNNSELKDIVKRVKDDKTNGNIRYDYRMIFVGLYDADIIKINELIIELKSIVCSLIYLYKSKSDYEGDKLQGWIDKLLEEKKLKVAGSSIRDGNRQMILDVDKTIKKYLQIIQDKNKSVELNR